MKPLMLALVFTCAMSSPSASGYRQNLAGLQKFNVIIYREDKGAVKLSGDRLKTKAELHLRTLGLPVREAGPSLVVDFGTAVIKRASETLYIGRVDVYLTEPCWLPEQEGTRAKMIAGSCVTWPSNSVGFWADREDEFRSLAEQAMLRLIDEFANDYLAANPKQPESSKPDK